MRKIAINSGVVCVCAFITIMLIFTIKFFDKVDMLEMVSNNLIPEGALMFRTSNSNIDFDDLYKALPPKTLLINNYSWDSNIRTVIFKDIDYKIPLSEGRNFSSKDIENRSNVVIIGGELLGENDKFYYNGCTYDVIGIMGCGFESEVDTLCIMLMNNRLLNCEGNFYIYGKDSQEIINFLGNEDIWKDVLIMENKALGITEAVDLKERLGMLPVMVICVCFAFNHIFWQKWVKDRTNEITIKHELGFSNTKIYLQIFFRAMLLVILGNVFAMIINYNAGIEILLKAVLFAGIIVIVCPALMLLWVYWRNENAN